MQHAEHVDDPIDARIHAPFRRSGMAALWRRLAMVMPILIGRARERRALADLDERLLRDVGIVRRDATNEVRKPLWRP